MKKNDVKPKSVFIIQINIFGYCHFFGVVSVNYSDSDGNAGGSVLQWSA